LFSHSDGQMNTSLSSLLLRLCETSPERRGTSPHSWLSLCFHCQWTLLLILLRVTMASKEEGDKKKFFDELFATDLHDVDDDDNIHDQGLEASKAFLNASKHRPHPSRKTSATQAGRSRASRSPPNIEGALGQSRFHPLHAPAVGMTRTVSAPNVIRKPSNEVTTVLDTPVQSVGAQIASSGQRPLISLLTRSMTTPISSIPRASGKRKRDGVIPLAPESHRIFRALNLCKLLDRLKAPCLMGF